MLVFVTDISRLERHFRLDPVLYAYCLGDLEEPWFSQCQWAGFYTATGNIAEDRHVQEVALIFRHDDGCTVQAFAQTELLKSELHLLSPLLPDSVHFHANDAALVELFTDEFEMVISTHPMIKMAAAQRARNLDQLVVTKTNAKSERLRGEDANAANELFAVAYPEAGVTPEVIDAAPFFGIRVQGKLVAIGGCHVWSNAQKVVVIGGVATHPEHRNQGYARSIVAAILTLAPTDYLICLNVAKVNPAAQRAYGQLGFVKTHDYFESRLRRR